MGRMDHIRALCRTLCFYRDRLPLLRDMDGLQAGDEPVRGYLSQSNSGMAYRAIRPWYKVVEPLYAELEGLMRETDAEGADRVLHDPEISRDLAKLHQLRAAYEFDKEVDQAKALLEDRDASSTLDAILAHQAYWTLPEAAKNALSGARRIAVLGSGPLPLTALSIVRALSCSVVCFERDPVAHRLGDDIIALSQNRGRVVTLNSAIEDFDGLATCDALISAVLLGVSMDTDSHCNKAALLTTLSGALRAGAPILLRDPHRLGALFYPALGADSLGSDLTIERYDPDTGPGLPYRSSFMIINRYPKP